MKKTYMFILYMIAVFVLLFTELGFCQGISNYEAERLILQKRSLKNSNKTVQPPQNIDDLADIVRERKERADTWYSTDPEDLEPLTGSTWEFNYTIISMWTDKITFGTDILITSDGIVALKCSDEYGGTGAVFYTELSSGTGGGFGFAAIIDQGDFYDIYFFKVDGTAAEGYYVFAVKSDGTQNKYQMTGKCISNCVNARTCLKGDLSGNGKISISDAILALQTVCGINSVSVNKDADVNRDGKIGLEEAIYVLQINTFGETVNGNVEVPSNIQKDNIVLTNLSVSSELKQDSSYEMEKTGIIFAVDKQTDKIIYFGYPDETDWLNMNPEETAAALILNALPLLAGSDGRVPKSIKDFILSYPEVQTMVNSLKASVAEKGYFDIQDVQNEYNAALNAVMPDFLPDISSLKKRRSSRLTSYNRFDRGSGLT